MDVLLFLFVVVVIVVVFVVVVEVSGMKVVIPHQQRHILGV